MAPGLSSRRRLLRFELGAFSIALWGTLISCGGSVGDGPVMSLHAFEADGWTCRDCGETADLDGMRQAIATGQDVDMVAWYAEHLVDPPNADRIKIIIAPEGQPLPAPGEPIQRSREDEWWQIDSRLHREQYHLRAPAGLFSYERKPLWYWVHVSRSYLVRFGEDGRKLWRRTIPILRLPIWPLTTDRGFLYVSDGLDGAFMVFVELDSGRLATFPLPNETRELWPVGVPSVLPYVSERFVVLPVHDEAPGPGGSAGFAELRSYVVIELAEGA